MVPYVVKSRAMDGMDKGITGRGNFGAVDGGGSILVKIPETVEHDERDAAFGDAICFVKPKFTSTCFTIRNLPPTVELISVGEHFISR